MKKIIVFKERWPFSCSHLVATFTSTKLAYDYLINYLNYLENDAKEYMGGKQLQMELLRLDIIRDNIKEILNWDLGLDANLHGLHCQGFELDVIHCIEEDSDLIYREEKGENYEF